MGRVTTALNKLKDAISKSVLHHCSSTARQTSDVCCVKCLCLYQDHDLEFDATTLAEMQRQGVVPAGEADAQAIGGRGGSNDDDDDDDSRRLSFPQVLDECGPLRVCVVIVVVVVVVVCSLHFVRSLVRT